jgi:large subunit ribosomal protein L9
MLVILKKDVKGTGRAGDVVKVSDGYARNMLIPKGMAVAATDKNIRSIEKQKAVLEEKRKEEKIEAEKIASDLEENKIEIKIKTGDNGKLFGSITAMDISKAIMEQEGVDIDKKKIQLKSPIKQTGEFEVEVKIYPEVVAKVNVIVMEN